MEIDAVLDTCVVVDLLSGRRAIALAPGRYAVSVITELKLLSKPSMSDAEEAQIRKLLSTVFVVELIPEVRTRAIALRQNTRLKLPDAIVAATAQAVFAPLITFDEAIIKAIPDTARQP